MPIKEIIVLSAAIMASVMAAHPTRPLEAVRELQFKILREVGRTDNWGNPSIFRHSVHTPKNAKALEPQKHQKY